MASKINLLFFGFLNQMIVLCSANESGGGNFENSYDYTEERYEDGNLSTGAIVGIVIGSIIILILKIFLCYRLRLRTTVITRTVVIRDTNPHHAGYEQRRNQPTAPPSYNEVVSPVQGPTSVGKKQNPPPYSPAP